MIDDKHPTNQRKQGMNCPNPIKLDYSAAYLAS